MSVDWSGIIMLAGAAVPIVGVPATLVASCVRGLQRSHIQKYGELVARLSELDAMTRQLTLAVAQLQRDSTTRQEWQREATVMRRHLHEVTQAVTRIETQLGNGHNILDRLADLTHVLRDLSGRKQ